YAAPGALGGGHRRRQPGLLLPVVERGQPRALYRGPQRRAGGAGLAACAGLLEGLRGDPVTRVLWRGWARAVDGVAQKSYHGGPMTYSGDRKSTRLNSSHGSISY